MMTPIDRAERAKRLMQDDVFRMAVADMRENMVKQLESCPISDVETQHEVALMLQLLRRLTLQLERYMQDGAVEEHRSQQSTWMQRMRGATNIG